MSEPFKNMNGSPEFYSLLTEMAETHDKKSHDYASNDDPFGNYHFSGHLSSIFNHCPEDVGFVTRIGEKLFRLANLEKSGKTPKNESVLDTERDLCVIMALWMASRRSRRQTKLTINEKEDLELYVINHEAECDMDMLYRVAAYIEAVIDNRKRTSARKSEHPHQS